MESLDKLFNYIINNRTFETILVTVVSVKLLLSD